MDPSVPSCAPPPLFESHQSLASLQISVIPNGGLPKPEWLSILPPLAPRFQATKEVLSKIGLVTVCQEAHCPNMSECWSSGTATFMILGDSCTRGCRFCQVKTRSRGRSIDAQEHKKLVEAVSVMDLTYVVVTSVDRDDLPDQGAGHFAECITELKKEFPDVIVEVLIPDFQGNRECIQTIINAGPHVIAHNIETVERLQPSVRDRRAGYHQSLEVLSFVKSRTPSIFTKSSIMLGLGETQHELCQVMDDLRQAGVDILTLGQYLRPSSRHLSVVEYVHPDQFGQYQKIALAKGFRACASGPLVRSSYRAGELFEKASPKNRLMPAFGEH